MVFFLDCLISQLKLILTWDSDLTLLQNSNIGKATRKNLERKLLEYILHICWLNKSRKALHAFLSYTLLVLLCKCVIGPDKTEKRQHINPRSFILHWPQGLESWFVVVFVTYYVKKHECSISKWFAGENLKVTTPTCKIHFRAFALSHNGA